MMNIVSQMFINVTIIISFLTFGNYFIREKGINPSSSLNRKISVGFVSGLLGCLLILYSIHFTQKVIADFRYIPILIMAFYASRQSTMVCALVIGIFRLVYMGINEASIMGFTIAIAVGLMCCLISKFKVMSWVKWVLGVLCIYLFAGVGFTILLIHSGRIGEVLASFIIGMGFVSFVMYFLSEYVELSNQLYRKMREDVKKDFLTGLNNVRQFDLMFNISTNNAKERNETLSMLFIDIDFFKRVNDTYGHYEGDLVLKELSNILIKTCRHFDIISRNGGEEFSAILLDCPLERATEVALRIRQNVEQHAFILSSGKKIKITVSIGVASYPQTTADVEKLAEQADIALYNAKRAGRNKVLTYKM